MALWAVPLEPSNTSACDRRPTHIGNICGFAANSPLPPLEGTLLRGALRFDAETIVVRTQRVPLTHAISDVGVDRNLAISGIEHDEDIESDDPLDAEALGLTVPRCAALVEPVERVRGHAALQRDAQTRIVGPVSNHARLVEESPAVDRATTRQRLEERLHRPLISQGGWQAGSRLTDRIPPQKEPQLGRAA